LRRQLQIQPVADGFGFLFTVESLDDLLSLAGGCGDVDVPPGSVLFFELDFGLKQGWIDSLEGRFAAESAPAGFDVDLLAVDRDVGSPANCFRQAIEDEQGQNPGDHGGKVHRGRGYPVDNRGCDEAEKQDAAEQPEDETPGKQAELQSFPLTIGFLDQITSLQNLKCVGLFKKWFRRGFIKHKAGSALACSVDGNLESDAPHFGIVPHGEGDIPVDMLGFVFGSKRSPLGEVGITCRFTVVVNCKLKG